ncbi:pyridoxamine 5'-phosphate oxidase family protein [Streptomyces sp. NPDC001816]|uniref:pyridoxamine 5'-phosphate oxidase family protein n=1 Tax=Streptomyces sp. NPDC001816 TaxID=3364612 RepID=UPI0036B4128F
MGRIIFTRHALPTARPVDHVLDDGAIIIRTHEGAALVSHARQNGDREVVVAYEAYGIDPAGGRIRPDLITGIRLVAADGGEP